VPPPPVCGAAAGNAGGGDEALCAGGGADEALCAGGGADEALCAGGGGDEALCAGGGGDEPDADAPPWPVDDVAGAGDREAWPVGDGVRVAGWLEDGPLAGAEGGKIDGAEEPPPVQAETVTARRTAPAAERTAISHAPWPATGGGRRSFMNAPRMRVR
jgi:hypothetical protein